MRANLQLMSFRALKEKGDLQGHFDNLVTNRFSIKNLPGLREKIEIAVLLPAISNLAIRMNKSRPLSLAYEDIIVTYADYLALHSLAVKIDNYIDCVIQFLEDQGVDGADEIGVSVKLAEASSLFEVNKKIERLDGMLGQALSILAEPSRVTVARWENGSLWIDLLVGSASGVLLIGGITWAAACAFKKYQEGKLIEKASEGMGIKNEVLQSLSDGVSSAIEALIEAEAIRLNEKHSKGKGDPETIGRLKHCIKETFEMIKEGTEIHPALMAPEEVKNVFPNLSETLNLPGIQKLLKAHAEDKDKDE